MYKLRLQDIIDSVLDLGRGHMQWEDPRIRGSTASGMVSAGKGLYIALIILLDPLLQSFTPNEGSSLFLIDALGKHHSWVCVAFPWELPETHGELKEGLDYEVKVRAC